nr:hypothetical protein [Tanacetum cinerariifolium]
IRRALIMLEILSRRFFLKLNLSDHRSILTDLQDKIKLWFTQAHTKEEYFVGEIHDFCFGLRVTLNKRVLRFGLKFHLKWHAFGVGYKYCRFLRAAAFFVGYAGASLENSRNLRTRRGIGYADLEYRRCLTDFICNIALHNSEWLCKPELSLVFLLLE